MDSVAATPETGGQDMLDLVKTALLTISDASEMASSAQALLAEWLASRVRPHVWTTLGHLMLSPILPPTVGWSDTPCH